MFCDVIAFGRASAHGPYLQVHRQVESRLREHFSQPQLAQPVRAAHPRNVTAEEREMRRRKVEPL